MSRMLLDPAGAVPALRDPDLDPVPDARPTRVTLEFRLSGEAADNYRARVYRAFRDPLFESSAVFAVTGTGPGCVYGMVVVLTPSEVEARGALRREFGDGVEFDPPSLVAGP